MKRFATAAVVVMVAIMVAMAVAAQAARVSTASEASYQAWCNKFDKSFCANSGGHTTRRSAAYMEGLQQFQELERVHERHNSNASSTWTMGMNEFSTVNNVERQIPIGGGPTPLPNGYTTGFVGPQVCSMMNGALYYSGGGTAHFGNWQINTAHLPTISNQGSCACCYAVVIRDLVAVKNNNADVSLDQLISCTNGGNYGNHGCSGGSLSSVLDYVNTRDGYSSALDYPFLGSAGTCQDNSATIFGWGSPYGYIMDEADYPGALVANGPLAMSMTVVSSFVNYYNGIYSGVNNGEDCSGQDSNHVVLVMGYGNYGTTSWYHQCRNSWGSDWAGLQGQIHIAAGVNMCQLRGAIVLAPASSIGGGA